MWRVKPGYYLRNKERIKRQAKAAAVRAKERVFDYYSNGTFKCGCCGEPDREMLNIDHINGRGYKPKRNNGRRVSGTRVYKKIISLGFPPDYRVLCFNCNYSASRHDGVCQHTLKNVCTDTTK